jgi:SulP family sulfate permease
MAEVGPASDGLAPRTIPPALVAGLVTGLFSIPEGMAYAQLAGVNPLYGLYAGMAATLVAALTTGSVLMISTLTSAIALSTGSVLVTAGIAADDMPGALFTVTLLTGLIMMLLGLLRLGSMVDFVSNSVMTGFIAGASLLILIGELGDFSGYEPEGGNKLAEVWDWLVHVGEWDAATTAVGVTTVVLVVLGKLVGPLERLAPVLVLVLMTVAVAVLDVSVETVADIASIPSGLPTPMLPELAVAPELALGAASVAIVALAQGAGISTAYPNPSGSPSPPSRDFVGQGLGNVAASFLQSMPAGGSLSRTGISVSAGAVSRWGGVLAALWLAVLVALFGSLAELVPLAVIAGLLFVIAVELITGRLRNAQLSIASSPLSALAMVLTFAATLFIPLQWSILLGVAFSLLVYLGHSFRAGTVNELVHDESGYWTERDAPDRLSDGAVTVIGLRNWDFFAEAPRLAQRLPQPGGVTGAVVVVRMRDIADIRSTGLRALDAYRQQLADSGSTLVLAGVQPQVADRLARTGLRDRIGEEQIFGAGAGITEALDAAYAHARRIAASES